MSVEDYQIGQLYTIQKKSRIESTGSGSGVEIIENKPFTKNNETGQYTLKVFHADERLPAALKTIAKLLFPKSALVFEEESWNFYPYTRTKYKHGYFKSFNIDIESKYLNDLGNNENAFGLTKSELSSRTVEFIDIVNDQINPNEYKAEEDPLTFVSSRTNRGPLTKSWIDELKASAKAALSSGKPVAYMCAYKLCRIEIAVWGCQSRVERLVSDSVLRSMILMSHRQAWCWQDEYVDLTIDDVRKLELETQHYLNLKMRNDPDAENYLRSIENMSIGDSGSIVSKRSDEKPTNKKFKSHENKTSSSPVKGDKTKPTSVADQIAPVAKPRRTSLAKTAAQSIGSTQQQDEGVVSEVAASSGSDDSFASQKNTNNDDEENSDYEDIVSDEDGRLASSSSHFNGRSVGSKKTPSSKSGGAKAKQAAKVRKSKAKSSSMMTSNAAFEFEIEDANHQGSDEYEEEDCTSQNSNFDEFYDAISQASFNLSTNTNESIETTSSSRRRLSKSKAFIHGSSTKKPRSKQRSGSHDNEQQLLAGKQKSEIERVLQRAAANEPKLSSNSGSFKSQHRSHNDRSRIDTLVLVAHGGNVTCTDTLKASDLANFKSTMESVAKKSHEALFNRMAYRLVPCESICHEALQKLSTLSPVASDTTTLSLNNDDDMGRGESSSASVFALHENLPFNTLPLLMLANQAKYREKVARFIQDCNKVYNEFLNSNEGAQFEGQVVVIGDSLGSLLVYDALCLPTTSTTIINEPAANESNYDDVSSSTASSLSNITATLGRPQTIQVQPNNHSLSPSPNVKRKDLSPASPRQPVTTTTTSPRINISSEDNSTNTDGANNSSNSNAFFRRNMSSGAFSAASSIVDLSPTSTNASGLRENNYYTPIEERLEFDVSHFFVFGSPLGLVLAFRKMANNFIETPCCTQIYNLFHLTDPVATRIEPMLCKQFRFIKPVMVPRYSKFPQGDGAVTSLDHFMAKYAHLFENEATKSNANDKLSAHTKKNWWGDNRIDYVLFAPDTIANLPKKSLPYIFHSCFWESTDVVAFILRVLNKDSATFDDDDRVFASNTTSSGKKEPAEKWQKRLNRVKLRKNLAANHRANDVIVLEDREQILTGKFSYGPLDFSLSGEKVDIYIMKNSSKGEWQFYTTEITDNHGRLRYEIPSDKRLPQGTYQIRMMVKCDHTYSDLYMSVLPPKTEAVVFSIDGSFAANISFSGNDPKVRAGSVDVVRHWQELGYMIIYITARPDMQHYKVTNWLAQHNFPLGMVYFSDGLSRDPIRQKTETLRNIVEPNNVSLQAAYGSSKDIPMYASLGVPASRIFIIGRMRTKYQNQAVFLQNGYASHLSYLQNPNTGSRQASGNARLILKKSCFSIKNTQISFNDVVNGGNNKDTAEPSSSLPIPNGLHSYHSVPSASNYSTISSAVSSYEQQYATLPGLHSHGGAGDQPNSSSNLFSSLLNNKQQVKQVSPSQQKTPTTATTPLLSSNLSSSDNQIDNHHQKSNHLIDDSKVKMRPQPQPKPIEVQKSK